MHRFVRPSLLKASGKAGGSTVVTKRRRIAPCAAAWDLEHRTLKRSTTKEQPFINSPELITIAACLMAGWGCETIGDASWLKPSVWRPQISIGMGTLKRKFVVITTKSRVLMGRTMMVCSAFVVQDWRCAFFLAKGRFKIQS